MAVVAPVLFMLDQFIDTASRIALSYPWLIAPALALLTLLAGAPSEQRCRAYT